MGVLQSPQPPPAEAILTALLNEITTIPDHFVLVLDDYHVIDAKPVDKALTFLLEHLPPQMHLVIATREDPDLPWPGCAPAGSSPNCAPPTCALPRRSRRISQPGDGPEPLGRRHRRAGNRTEGWIAGLQLAALSMQGPSDAASFIQSFTGSHHFVLDYLVEEVLQQQPESVQTFLLRTSILDRLCGPLCDAVVLSILRFHPSTLEYIERANLFIVPLDNERRWYRYHHLFADLLRQRLQQSLAASGADAESGVAELHIRASQWYEDHGLEIEAFQHAAAANDIERAERLIEGKGMPSALSRRGDARCWTGWRRCRRRCWMPGPRCGWRYASLLLVTGQTTGVEEKLQAAEAALQGTELDDKTRNLIGHIAAIRALLAAAQYQVEAMLAQSRRALEYLHPDNLPVRTATIWTLGYAYQLQGDRAAASQAYAEAMAISQTSGNIIINLAATIGLGNVQESENQLHLAAETYRRVLQLAGDQPQQII